MLFSGVLFLINFDPEVLHARARLVLVNEKEVPEPDSTDVTCSSLSGEASIGDEVDDENLPLHCIENQKMTPATNNEARTVRFGTVKIREYESTLGDNPSVRNGPPVGLGWKSKDLKDFTVDEFEEGRSSIRRGSDDLLVCVF